jgi:cation diffusion facilitator family transporter
VTTPHAIPPGTQRIERRAAVLAVGVGIVLLVAKFVAYALTGSAAIFTDAAESIVNVLASLFAAWAVWYAQQPPDERHPYGHGKIEFLSALFEGGMILMAALVAGARAAEALWRGPELERLGAGLMIVAAAGAVNGITGLILKRTGRRTGSLTLEADGRHLLTDAVTSVALLAALGVIALSGWQWLDPVAAVALAIYLGWEGLHLVRRGFVGLMDTIDPEDDALLTRLLHAHVEPHGKAPRVCGFHALRHRHVGRDHWVDFHLVVPRSWDIARGHAVATAIEIELQDALGNSDPDTPGSTRATAHVEPCAEPGCTHCPVEGGAP